MDVSGLPLAVWLNGTKLKKTGPGKYLVTEELCEPWENEVLVLGWPWNVRFEVRRTTSHPETISEKIDDPLLVAGRSLSAFIVAQGEDKGEIFSFYDPVDNTFRLKSWRWDTGICLEALARLAHVRRDKKLAWNALKVAGRMLSIQLDSAECPGGFPELEDLHMAPRCQPLLGQWVVPFNGAFIGAGLLAASKIADQDFGEKCRNSADKANKLMELFAVSGNGWIKGYFHLGKGKWLYHGQINDSGIYPRLPSLLSEFGIKVNGALVKNYAMKICSLIQPEGFVSRAVFKPGGHTFPPGRPLFPEWKKFPQNIPAKIFTRGQAWCILGLSSAWKLANDMAELKYAVKVIIDYLLSKQDSTGFWHHDLSNPSIGLDVKGTAVAGWAILEAMECYKEAGGDVKRLKDAVKRAWDALLVNQRKNMSSPIPGALLDESQEGGIIYFRNRPMYSSYCLGAFILMGLLMNKL